MRTVLFISTKQVTTGSREGEYRASQERDLYYAVLVAGLDNKNLSEHLCIVHTV